LFRKLKSQIFIHIIRSSKVNIFVNLLRIIKKINKKIKGSRNPKNYGTRRKISKKFSAAAASAHELAHELTHELAIWLMFSAA